MLNNELHTVIEEYTERIRDVKKMIEGKCALKDEMIELYKQELITKIETIVKKNI